MPKRSTEEQLKRYYKKIKRLEEKYNEVSGRENDERLTIDEVFDGQEENVLPVSVEEAPQEIVPEDPVSVSSQFAPKDPVSQQDSTPPQEPIPPQDSVPPPEAVLDLELILALGASTSDAPEFGEAIHDSLSNLWTPLLKKGLNKEEKDKIIQASIIPDNCRMLQAPKLNAEISAAVVEIVRNRDKKVQTFQQQLGSGMSAINRGMNVLLMSDDKLKALKFLSDGCRILSDLHCSFTKDRVKLITPNLEKNFTHVIRDCERDETLFGTSLSDKIKASKAIEKQGQQIKKTVPKQVTPQASTSSYRATNPGNWSGPSRFSSNRGGRGSFRRTAPATTAGPARRSYPTSTTAATSSRPPAYSQKQTRAPH